MKKSSLGRPLKKYIAEGDDDDRTEHHALLSTFVLVTTQSRSFSNLCKSYRLLAIEEIASRRTRHLIIQRQLRCSKAEVDSNSVQVHSSQAIRTLNKSMDSDIFQETRLCLSMAVILRGYGGRRNRSKPIHNSNAIIVTQSVIGIHIITLLLLPVLVVIAAQQLSGDVPTPGKL